MTGICRTSFEERADFSQMLPEIERYRFTAKEWDEETGLYYMSARYQNPEASRWVSSDPVGWGLVNPMDGKGNLRNGFSIVESMNPYSYSSNNPIRYSDPTGFDDVDAVSGAQPVYENPQPEWYDNKAINQQLYQTNMENEFADTLRSLRGTPYVEGGSDSSGADCSGIIRAALEIMGFETDRYRASDMANGEPEWLEMLDQVDSSIQGEAGVLNFYGIMNSDVIDHVNAGVGQKSGEAGNQIIDATFGNWMVSRNGRPKQIYPAAANTVNQTYSPFSTKRIPQAQGRINFSKLKRKENE